LTYQKNRRKKIVLAISQRFAAILEHIDCLVSLTPCFSGVWAEVGGSQPFQRFQMRNKPLKRFSKSVAE
jgi:hypothetical protein